MKFKLSKQKYFLLILTIIFGLFLGSMFVLAQDNSTEQKEEKNSKLESVVDDKEEKLNEIQDDIERYTADITRLEQDVQKLDTKIEISKDEIQLTDLAINKTNTEMEQTDAEIQITKEQVEEKEEDLQYNKKVLGSLLRDIRQQDDMSALALFLNTASFSEILDIERQTQNYQGETQDTYDTVKSMRDELIAKEQELEKKKKEQEDLKSQLEAQQKEIERQRTQNEQLLNDTERNQEKYTEMIGAAADEQRKLSQEIQELEQSLLQQASGGSRAGGPPVTGSGVFMVPVKDGLTRISQGYGLTSYAQTGVYGYQDGNPRIHAGVDFAVPCGTAIYNMADGVVDATFSLEYGFGQGVVIWHDNLNLYSLQGHMSQIAVAPGQILKRGDIVGFVGSTGFSTGCHSHTAAYIDMRYVETSYGRSPWYAPEQTLNPMGLFGNESDDYDSE